MYNNVIPPRSGGILSVGRSAERNAERAVGLVLESCHESSVVLGLNLESVESFSVSVERFEEPIQSRLHLRRHVRSRPFMFLHDIVFMNPPWLRRCGRDSSRVQSLSSGRRRRLRRPGAALVLRAPQASVGHSLMQPSSEPPGQRGEAGRSWEVGEPRCSRVASAPGQGGRRDRNRRVCAV